MQKMIFPFLFLLTFSFPGFGQNDSYVKEYSVNNSGQESDFYLGFGGGFNNYLGLIGPSVEYIVAEKIAVFGGAGLGSWGNKVSAGIKYYGNFPEGWSFNLGISHSFGLAKIEFDIPAAYLFSGVDTKVPFELKGASTLNLSASKNWMLGTFSRNRFSLEVGYAVPIQEDPYSIKSNDKLNGPGKYFMDILQPGGINLGLGFSFGL